MVTTVVNALADRLLEEFPPNRSYSVSDLESMPRPVADYLKHEMELRLLTAIPEPGSENWVDSNQQAVKRARAQYYESLAALQRIPSDQWAAVLERACEETLQFLVRPSSTLSEIVFRNVDGAAHPDQIYTHLEYFSAYPYFREVIEAYFEQKSIARIDRERFEGLINRIDRQMTSDYGPPEWKRLLRPLLDVLDAAGYADEIPVDVLAVFLDEKGADEALARLKDEFADDAFVSASMLGAVFEKQVEVSTNGARRRTERMPSEASREQERSPVPLWKQFEQGPSTDEPVKDRPTRSGSSEPLWKQFRKSPESVVTETATAPESPLADLERSVLGSRGARNRELFVRHLFSGNRDEYESTLRKLQRVGSWSEASKVIAQDVFLKHQVNIYSDPAVAFTDAAESKYRS